MAEKTTKAPKKATLYDKLLYVQTNLKVKKSRHNSFGNYDFRNVEDIMEALKPFLKEIECVILFNDEIVQVADDRFYVKATATLTNGEETISTVAFARESNEAKAKMDCSQTTGSTSSYARKFALNGLLAIDDSKDVEEIEEPEDFSQIGKINDLQELREYYKKTRPTVKDVQLFDKRMSERAEVLKKEAKSSKNEKESEEK